MEKNRYVYLIFAGDDPKPFYVGVGKEKPPGSKNRNRREKDHFRPSKWGWSNPEKDAFIRSGVENGVVFRFEYERGLTVEEAYSREIELIEYYGRRDLGTGCLFNACRGGWGSVDKSPSAKARCANGFKGRNHTEVSRALIKAARAKQIMPKGFIRSPEERAAISAAKKGVPTGPCPPDRREKISKAQQGKSRKPWTEERRAKQAATLAAKAPFRHTDETKARIAASHEGIRPNEESRAKMSASQKARTDWKAGEEHHSYKKDASSGALATRRFRARQRGEDVPVIRRTTGPVVSLEARARAAEKIRGTKRSAEARARMSEAAKRRTNTTMPETVALR